MSWVQLEVLSSAQTPGRSRTICFTLNPRGCPPTRIKTIATALRFLIDTSSMTFNLWERAPRGPLVPLFCPGPIPQNISLEPGKKVRVEVCFRGWHHSLR